MGPLLYNVFINDVFWFSNHAKICNYVDDTTVSVCRPDLDIVIRQLEDDCSVIVKWFSGNLLKLNDEECHPMMLVDKTKETTTIM